MERPLSDPPKRPTTVWAGRFTRPEDMAEAQRDANVEAIHTARGAAYRSRLAFVDLGRFRVHDAMDDAHIARGAMLPRACGVLFPWGGVAPGLRVNGCAFTDGQGVFVKPGAELHVVMDGPQRWSGIIMDDDALATFGGEDWLRADAAVSVLPDLLRRVPALRDLSAELGALAHDDPARIGAGTVPDALVEAISQAIGHACLPDERGWDRALLLHRRVRVVAAAEEFLATVIGGAIYTQQIAAALGVSERFLTASFAAVYRMSVHRYLRVRRLNLVRRALAGPPGSSALVKTIALDLGFWHLGQFTRDYRSLFGETPTDTLAKAHGRRGAAPTERQRSKRHRERASVSISPASAET